MPQLDCYGSKLDVDDQTRFALTPPMERLLCRDHLCFHEALIPEHSNKDITRIISGYLRMFSVKDAYALDDQITNAFDSREKLGKGVYRLRFDSELTTLINSFPFSSYKGFDKRVLVETILQRYCALPYAEREKIFFYDTYLTIAGCIKAETELDICVRTITGALRHFSYQPYIIETDESTGLAYLAGYSREVEGAGRYQIFCTRLQRIVSAVDTKRHMPLKPAKRDAIQQRLDELGIAYINTEIETFRVALTEDGYQRYLKLLIHQRPLPDSVEQGKDSDWPYVLTFHGSRYQMHNYFFTFGRHIKILSPDHLREQFAQEYRDAAALYGTEAL